MTITLTFSAETERRLQELAAQAGQTVEGFIRQLVENEVLQLNGKRTAEAGVPPASKTFDEIFAPLRKEVEESGITDAELDQLLEQARAEVWQERMAKKGRP